MFTHQVEGKFQGPDCSAVAAEIGLSFSAAGWSLWLKIYKPETPKWSTVNSQGVHIKGSKSLEDLLSPILPEASQTRPHKKKCWNGNAIQTGLLVHNRQTPSLSYMKWSHTLNILSSALQSLQDRRVVTSTGHFHQMSVPWKYLQLFNWQARNTAESLKKVEGSQVASRSTTHGILKMLQFTADSKANGTWTFFLLVASPSSNLMQSWFRRIFTFFFKGFQTEFQGHAKQESQMHLYSTITNMCVINILNKSYILYISYYILKNKLNMMII